MRDILYLVVKENRYENYLLPLLTMHAVKKEQEKRTVILINVKNKNQK